MSELTHLGQLYDLDQIIGRGPTATVYRGRRRATGQTVVVKILQESYSHDPRFAVRFREHFRRVANLEDGQIVPTLDYGSIDNRYYIVTPLIDGQDLATHLARHGPLPPPEAATLTQQLCRIGEAARQNGYFLGGLKPQNILLTADGQVQVTDLGFSRVTSESGLSKTRLMLDGVPYMSPEQTRGEAIGPASDVYTLGVLLYQMLTGQLPFAGRNTWSLVRMEAGETPPSPRRIRRDVPGELAAVALRALRRAPNERYTTPAEMAQELASARPIAAAPPRPKAWWGLNRQAMIATVARMAQRPQWRITMAVGLAFPVVVGMSLLASRVGWTIADSMEATSPNQAPTVQATSASPPEWYMLSGFESAGSHEPDDDHGKDKDDDKDDNHGKGNK